MINGTANNIKYPRVYILDTLGGYAVTALIICIISGVVLAIPFDIVDPYASISAFLLNNPGAVIARNLHYWSAQIFLIFSVLHIWEHLALGTERGIRAGVWLRLGLGIVVILYAMLSGFILKGDLDSEQALRIFKSLIETIPFIGDKMAFILLGGEDSYLLLYVNHVAIATIFIIAILFEHARILWGRAITFILLSLILVLASLFFHAPLHDGQSAVIKGPWYFLGLQEILHWMHRPGWVWLILFLLILPILILPFVKENGSRILKIFLLTAFIMYAALTVVGYFFRGAEWEWTWRVQNSHMPFDPVPIRQGSFYNDRPLVLGTYGRAESCMLCHDGMTGFSPAHDPEAIGCVSCHLGNPFVPDKEQAHAGMLRVPGNLENASRSCGTANCHPEITDRIHTSLMTTNSGIVAVDRFVFNELDVPDGHFHIQDIGFSAADRHLRNLCARCHLGNLKLEPGPVTQESRGGGCNACHLNYSAHALNDLNEYYGTLMQDSSLWTGHPSVDLNITDNHCFGCHSRSGRIAPSYEGWHETLLDKDEIIRSDTLRVLEDGRVFRFIEADVHHRAGLQCIDCHDSYELMGDGKLYMHEEDAVKISCEDRHFSGEPLTLGAAALDQETRKIMQVREIPYEDRRYLVCTESGKPIWNTNYTTDDGLVMLSKVSGHQHPLNPPAEICTRGNAHDRLTCQSCHSSWVPQCIGCHNEYDPKVAGYDMLKMQEEQGSWVEYVGRYLAGPPTMGVVENGEEKIHTFVPGMVLSIDKASFDPDASEQAIFHRLFAPISAHTTNSTGRSCRSCHNDALALGYGYGNLRYVIEEGAGTWQYQPRFAANKYDGLPEDAWIDFLTEPDGRYSTRTNTRPFSLEEQQSILLVGSCLECHNENSELMLSTLDDFEVVLERRTERCILPDYHNEAMGSGR